nr:Clp protease N-terminal domain-containing protein [Nocardia bovistercoris]
MAQEEAQALDHHYIGTEHLLLGLIFDPGCMAAKSLESLGISLIEVRSQVEDIIGRGQQPPSGHIPFATSAKKVLELSLREALAFGHNYIGTEHLLLGVIRQNDGVGASVLTELGIRLSVARETVVGLLAGHTKTTSTKFEEEPAEASRPATEAPRRAATTRPSLLLDEFSRDLTQAARDDELDLVIGRSREIERVMQVLGRRTKNNPVLIGEPGAGKTAVIEGLARAIARGEVPSTLEDKRIQVLDIPALFSGTSDHRAAEERLGMALAEADAKGEFIVVIDELHSVPHARGAHRIGESAPLLALTMRYNNIRLIGTATAEFYREHVETDVVLARALQTIPIAEASVAETVTILHTVRQRYEAYHGVAITEGALAAAARLAERDTAGRVRPGSAVALIDEAGSRIRVRHRIEAPETQALDARIAERRRAKEAAIDDRNFEEAARLRDKEKELVAERAEQLEQWRQTKQSSPLNVDATLIEEVHAESLPASMNRRGRRAQASLPADIAATLIDADAEIWSMV